MQPRTCMLTCWLRGWGRLLHACSPCIGPDEVAAYRMERKAQQARACCPSQQLSSTCTRLLRAHAPDPGQSASEHGVWS